MNNNYVMVVDDDSYSTELYNVIMESSPYKSYFRSEEDAVKALDDLKYLDLNEPGMFPVYILLDLNMPEINGLEFIKIFRETFPDRISSTSFIITTSSVRTKDKNDALSFDCVKDLIIKPIPANYIEQLIINGINADSDPQA